jgi:hypothetical protein
MVDDEVIAMKGPREGSVYRERFDGRAVVGLVQCGEGLARSIGPVPEHLEPGLLIG